MLKGTRPGTLADVFEVDRIIAPGANWPMPECTDLRG